MSPNPAVTVTVNYDDDATGAADALLAVLKPPRASVEPCNDEEVPADSAA